MSEHRGWLGASLAAVLVITAARLVLLWLAPADLWTAEAEIWLWGRDLSLSYGGHPPLAGWLAWTMAGIGDGAFWLRLPAPLLIGAAALVLGGICARLFGRRAALAGAVIFVTLPGAALSGLGLSTGAVMAPFLAGALAMYLRLLDRRETWVAAAAGALLGLAVLADLQALLFVACAALAGAVFHEARPHARAAATLAGTFAVVVGPFAVHAIAAGPAWPLPAFAAAPEGAHPVLRALLVGPVYLGPLPLAAVILAAIGWTRQTPPVQFLLLFAIPILAIGAVLALVAGVYPGLGLCLAGTALAAALMVDRHRGWLAATLAINGAASLALPLAALLGESLPLPGPDLAPRAHARAETSRTLLDIARDLGVGAIVVADRGLLADLAFAARGTGKSIHAAPESAAASGPAGRILQPAPLGRDVLLVQPTETPVPCPGEAMDLLELAPGQVTAPAQTVYLLPGLCLAEPDA